MTDAHHMLRITFVNSSFRRHQRPPHTHTHTDTSRYVAYEIDMSVTTRIAKFWDENYSIVKDTKGKQCPTAENVHSHFIALTGLSHITLDTFKVK